MRTCGWMILKVNIGSVSLKYTDYVMLLLAFCYNATLCVRVFTLVQSMEKKMATSTCPFSDDLLKFCTFEGSKNNHRHSVVVGQTISDFSIVRWISSGFQLGLMP